MEGSERENLKAGGKESVSRGHCSSVGLAGERHDGQGEAAM